MNKQTYTHNHTDEKNEHCIGQKKSTQITGENVILFFSTIGLGFDFCYKKHLSV